MKNGENKLGLTFGQRIIMNTPFYKHCTATVLDYNGANYYPLLVKISISKNVTTEKWIRIKEATKDHNGKIIKIKSLAK